MLTKEAALRNFDAAEIAARETLHKLWRDMKDAQSRLDALTQKLGEELDDEINALNVEFNDRLMALFTERDVTYKDLRARVKETGKAYEEFNDIEGTIVESAYSTDAEVCGVTGLVILDTDDLVVDSDTFIIRKALDLPDRAADAVDPAGLRDQEAA